jgi:two-component system cell cycle sensor histidine kinase/response regulator CckA
VVMNLCLNARDALLDRIEGKCRPVFQSDETPTITIETENVTIDEEYSRLHLEARPGRFVRLTVSDNGCGMDAETKERVFEPFFTTKEVDRGTGLGMAMVRSIVRGYDGWVNLYSEPGVGTTVSVYLPRAEGAAGFEEESEMTDALPTGSETILFVDDEEDVIEVGRRILEMQGYRVHLARDGQEALEVYRREREHIDLVLLDLTMPKMSGQDVMHEILRLDPKAKIVLTSGHSANGAGRAALGEGVIAFVQKPFDFRELAQAVRDALDG